MNITAFFQLIVSGALMGMVYALIAYGFQLIYATSKSINVGLFGFSAAENIWGRDDRPFPTPFSSEALQFYGISITPQEIYVAVGVLMLMGTIEFFKRKTMLGKNEPSSRVDGKRAHFWAGG